MKKDAVQRQLPTAFVGYKGPVLVLLPKGKKSSRSLLPACFYEKRRSAAPAAYCFRGVQGPRFGSFAERQKIQWVCTNFMA
ncbi:hypothetical protein N8450_02730 [Schleiferiaceae bacterium]|nr:hypothetical protein [Schleiferiaceae bacterium]